MKIFGWEITRRKKALGPVDDNRGWWPIIRESFAGAWQQNIEVKLEDTLSYWAVFRCISIISSDIAKLRLKLVQKDSDGIWIETEDKVFLPVLTKPNRYQNRIQFFQTWLESKLSRGNTYALKQRDNRGKVTGLYILDPARVRPLVSDETGDVFYQLDRDNLSELRDTSIVVPAEEIIHDRWNTLYHPLVGLSPLYAAGLNAIAGLNIQKNSAQFFGNNSRPGGVLVAPGAISEGTAQRLKEYWDTNFSGSNAGKVAVLGDGLKYEQMSVTAIDAQLIEQLRWTAETIAGAFGVPAYMLNIGGAPTYNNVEALRLQYYSQCLQALIEAIELCLKEGLALPPKYDAQFDLDDLMQMDTATKTVAVKDAIGAGFMKPNEGRAKFNLPPVKGGDTPYLQQQNYSLAALDARDKLGPPVMPGATPGGTPDNAGTEDGGESDSDEEARGVDPEVIRTKIGSAVRRHAAPSLH